MEPHPRNTDFAWRDHAGPFRGVTDAQARQYDEQGFFILEDAFDAETIAGLIAELDPIEAEFEAYLRQQRDGRLYIARADEITFAAHIVKRSPAARAFSRHQIFQDVCHDLIGPDVRLYWDQLVYKKPGNPSPFPWHQDNGYAYVEPQHYLTFWVALTEATDANGCPLVLPGRHREGTFAHRLTDLGYVCAEDVDGAVAAPVKPGGVVVFSSLTPHATGPNVSGSVRKAYILQYAAAGAVIREQAGREVSVPADDADRQYLILEGGRAVSDARRDH